MERVILHSDMNNFYASVECLYNPSLRDKPLAVSSQRDSKYGIILAKNYKAKKYKVQTGDPIWQSKQKCPQLVIVPAYFRQYMRFSKMAIDIYKDYTDKIESFVVVKSSKIEDSYISRYGEKDGLVNIIDSEVSGSMGYSSAPITFEKGTMELENVKITNPGTHAIHAEYSRYESKDIGIKIRIKGTLEIDGAKREAILLKKGTIEKPIELYIDGDIKQKGDTYTVKAEKEGTYTKVYYDDSKIERLTDKWSNAYYNTKNREGNKPETTVYENKLVGENRYQTAIKVSNEGWDEAKAVVIVNSDSIVDALSVTPYAKWLGGPILLTEGNKLNSDTKKEILRLKAKAVKVIGGESAVSNSVINELKSMNLYVERISGNDRYGTSLEIAKKLNLSTEIVVVNGVTGLPDAVSIAPVAAEKDMPIVLVSPKEGIKAFDQYLKENTNNLNIKKSYIIGKEAVISNKIANKLPNPERLGGRDRNETNAVILEKFYTSEELNNIFIAKDGMKKPDDLIDALSVGVLAAEKKSPVVIVGDDLNDKQESLLSKKQPNEITQVGGNGNENAFNKLVNMFKK
ncbi:cell wall-binding repeat-containing protein [Metaclostridioides mangenotii]|uniref:cell wall-binding repeat-containing protein n=1 Tax=Metaclostridioides mangenotii TaxID=1540 RepID=UPI00068B4A97|nr:cell wall-binding repeat-containing protein [Clostridioides mangenotii]